MDRCKVPRSWTLKSGQQNASSVDSKSPMHSFELRTSSPLPRCSRVTSNPEVKPQKRDDQNWASGTRGIYEMGCSHSLYTCSRLPKDECEAVITQAGGHGG